MLTVEQKFKHIVPEELQQLPEAIVPDELIKQWDAEVKETWDALEAGEIVPMTAEELAAHFGMTLSRDKR